MGRGHAGEARHAARGPVVAIDGPAASGKGTLARRLAAHLGMPHLDTGLLYRATGLSLIRDGVPLDDVAAAVRAASAAASSELSDPRLRDQDVGEAGSVVSAIPEVRAALDAAQRAFAATPGGAVLDGRDIGTVICPDADLKVFVTASPGERARRRALDLSARGQVPDHPAILADILRRDARDGGRAVAPLRAAPDAHVLDTTQLDADATFRAVLALLPPRLRLAS